MSKILITGSSDGLGLLAAKMLIQQGHEVVLHARNEQRAKETMKQLAEVKKILVANLSSTEETIKLAEEANTLGRFDAVIHNAGVYQAPEQMILHVNILAPYILTCMIQKPKRLIYLSSGMHMQGDPSLKSITDNQMRPTYSDSKLHVVILSMAVARKWRDVYSNSVNPGWVPTKMGGKNAPDDLDKGAETQVWLAASNDPQAIVTGKYFHYKKEKHFRPEAAEEKVQEKFLDVCHKITGISFPEKNADDINSSYRS
jgi:NAD(P)-dependent dehydrogenase (short-subunit alcohol dehydrogenase family)